MAVIKADARDLSDLLRGKTYSVDYFQREYRWREEQIDELVDDLTGRFLSAWRPEHPRKERAGYPSYFLGSIIVSGSGAGGSIIDGQQRLTSLTILLIWVYRRLTVGPDREQLSGLIYTYVDGEYAFNIDVPERNPAFESLFNQTEISTDDAAESVRTIIARYSDIEERMPQVLKDGGIALAMFADWLIRNVFLVEIRTTTDDEAYAIFESMNDRGLALTEADMLKGHLLSKVTSDTKRKQLNQVWKQRIDEVLRLEGDDGGGKSKDGEAIKAWLRARHAQTIRPREQGAQPQDFDRIGTEFHRWVRDSSDRLGLHQAADYASFVERDFNFYSGWYLRFRLAAKTLTEGREVLHCNALANFTMQYPLMLAPIKATDDEATAWRKALVVATFIDILIARRQWNGRDIGYNTMQYAMFLAMLELRDKSALECAELLKVRLEQDAPPFSENPTFSLGYFTKKPMRRFLARLTAWLDAQLGKSETLGTYLKTTGAAGFDIEHIIHNSYDDFAHEYPTQFEFEQHRNMIGGLLLLPRSVNRSLSSMGYIEKREKYLSQCALAQTLHPRAYDNEPNLKKLINEAGLPFEAHETFSRDDLLKRQELYCAIAEQVWHPDRLFDVARGSS
jgi:hypothetical protein